MTTIKEPNITGTIVCYNIPDAPGVYIVTDHQDDVLYIGSTNNLRRIIAYLEAHVHDKSANKYLNAAADPLYRFQAEGKQAKVHYIKCEDYKEKAIKLRGKYRPPWNKRIR
jgi:excinuclease UvrABC nuclease subunit